MKKLILTIVFLSSFMLSACSLAEEVNHSLEYVQEVTEQINLLSNFAEEAPNLFQDAVVNPEAAKELETQLNGLKTSLDDFNKIEVPALAESIHEQLVLKNKSIIEEINTLVNNGNIALDKIENTQIFNTMNDVISLLNRIENLGF